MELVADEPLPEWVARYFTKAADNYHRCNICEVNILMGDKSIQLINHVKDNHKDVLHKENPEDTERFPIEFIHLNGGAEDLEDQPILIGEVCRAAAEEVIQPTPKVSEKNEQNLDQRIVLMTEPRKSENSSDKYDNPRSWVWKYFRRVSKIRVRCNLCNVALSIKGSPNSMNRHVRARHPNIYRSEAVKKGKISITTDQGKSEFTVMETPTAVRTEEICASEKNTGDPLDNPRRSWVWKYFRRVNKIRVRCNLCNVALSIKGSPNSMNRHVRARHPNIYRSEAVKKGNISITTDQGKSEFTVMETPTAVRTEEICASEKNIDDPVETLTLQRQRRSWIWKYSNRISATSAQCKLCNRNIRHGGKATGNMNRHLKMIHNKTGAVADEPLPEWVAIYFTKVGDNHHRCNICEVNILVGDKSIQLINHIKDNHKEVYDLHKENPEATVGFRIEFLHLNVLKDGAGDLKDQPVLIGEVCEAAAEEVIQPTPEVLDKDEQNSDQNIVLVTKPRKSKGSSDNYDNRKRSWVWKYFHRMSNIIFRCNLCNVVLSIKGCNTNNMNRHVRTRHPNIYRSEAMKKGNISITTDQGETEFTVMETPMAVKTEEICASEKDIDDPFETSTLQRQRRSWIWLYFDRISATSAQCKLCSRNICHGGNATGNMNRHLKMIHHKTGDDHTWVWKVFESNEDDFYSCKICQYQCMKFSDIDKSVACILNHLKVEHGVVSGDQIITGTDDCEEEVQ